MCHPVPPQDSDWEWVIIRPLALIKLRARTPNRRPQTSNFTVEEVWGSVIATLILMTRHSQLLVGLWYGGCGLPLNRATTLVFSKDIFLYQDTVLFATREAFYPHRNDRNWRPAARSQRNGKAKFLSDALQITYLPKGSMRDPTRKIVGPVNRIRGSR